MKQQQKNISLPGSVTSVEKLKSAKARQFAHYLLAGNANSQLLEIRESVENQSETIVFELKVERPQLLAHQINRVEPLGAIFVTGDDKTPEVVSLRPDFPSVPHLNLSDEEFPRSICLYEQPFEQTRLNWTPADFLKRIHYWFSETAKGSLHAADQPLEPLVSASNYRLILPAEFTHQTAGGNR